MIPPNGRRRKPLRLVARPSGSATLRSVNTARHAPMAPVFGLTLPRPVGVNWERGPNLDQATYQWGPE
jgi:hypothetical protein